MSKFFSENWKKINTDPVCFGARDDSYGAFRLKRVGLSIHLNSFISTVQLVVPLVFLPIGDVTLRVNIKIKHFLPSLRS